MSSKNVGLSEGGQPIYRHERTKDFQTADSRDSAINEIFAHFEKHIGKIAGTYHEIVSDLVHIDIHIIEPTKDRNFYTLFTTGMSDRPMAIPEEAKEYQYGELLMCLPSDWILLDEAFKDEINYWPIRWLKKLARFPHEYDAWLGFGHTFPNGDPAQPFCKDIDFCCMMISYPLICRDIEDFIRLKINDKKIINFYSILPLFSEEVSFKLNNSAEDLLEKFDEFGYNEILNIKRQNVCKQ